MKNKLTLDADALRVESFGTVAERSGRGTVHANGYTQPGYPSCDRTCGATPPPDTDICVEGGPTYPACCV